MDGIEKLKESCRTRASETVSRGNNDGRSREMVHVIDTNSIEVFVFLPEQLKQI
jgi:hypothetical protein